MPCHATLRQVNDDEIVTSSAYVIFYIRNDVLGADWYMYLWSDSGWVTCLPRLVAMLPIMLPACHVTHPRLLAMLPIIGLDNACYQGRPDTAAHSSL